LFLLSSLLAWVFSPVNITYSNGSCQGQSADLGLFLSTGYYTFNPTFQQLQYEKGQARKSSSPSDLSTPSQGADVSAQASSEKDPKSSTQ
jgi:hypothetical protein